MKTKLDMSKIAKGLGAQLEDQGAHFRQRGLGKANDIVERLAKLRRVFRQHFLRRPRPQGDAVHGLRDRIVQIARQTLALLQRHLVSRSAEQARIVHR